MAAPAVTATEVGQILIYVAPGFVARAAYAFRFPRRRRTDLETLVVSVVASVPLVAAGNAVADGLGVARDVTDLGYVALVLGLAIMAGYATALTRGTNRIRRWSAKVGFRQAPEHSVAELVFSRLPTNSLVYVNFKDGRALAGNPSAWTFDPEASTRELYVHYPSGGETMTRVGATSTRTAGCSSTWPRSTTFRSWRTRTAPGPLCRSTRRASSSRSLV